MTDHPAPTWTACAASSRRSRKGLQAFHGKEMLHQDLRPDNVMIDRTGTVKIIDFGVDPRRRPRRRHARRPRGAIAGSAAIHRARVFHRRAAAAPRSDLFSLAVLAYQMLTGQLPYGLQVSRLRSPRRPEAAALRAGAPSPARAARPGSTRVLQKALHPNPAKRQEAVSEFVHDLRSPGRQFQRLRRRRWWSATRSRSGRPSRWCWPWPCCCCWCCASMGADAPFAGSPGVSDHAARRSPRGTRSVRSGPLAMSA